MAERDAIVAGTGATIPLTEAVKHDPAEIQKLRAEKKARLASVLDRGIVADRLHVELPEGLYGEWVFDDKAEIHRMETLGFKIDTEYATKRRLHDKGDGRSVVGDTVFMVCERETKEILDEIRRERYEAINGKPGQMNKSQFEERQFEHALEKVGMPLIEESRERAARKADIAKALGGESSPSSTPIK